MATPSFGKPCRRTVLRPTPIIVQTNFLTAYQQLKTQDHITGLWLLHGDDPLVLDFFVEALRPIFKKNNQLIKRVTLSAALPLSQVLGELSNLSLFGEHSALIVSGKSSSDKHAIQALETFAAQPNGHCLIYTLPKQDKKAKASKLFLTFAKYGVVIDCTYDEQKRYAIAKQKAAEFDIGLTNEAWQILLGATENNLLGAYQILWQLSYVGDKTITPKQVLAVLTPSAQYSVFDLQNALLMGDGRQCQIILNHLKTSNTAAPLVLWALSQEIHLLLNLNHKTTSELGIWFGRKDLYQSAKHHLNTDDSLLAALFEIDCLIKGVKAGDPWREMVRLCLRVCG